MPNVDSAPIMANALALALKEWNAGIHDYASLNVAVARDIASLEHKSPTNPNVLARARVATATVIAAKSGSDYPSGGIVNAIGGTISEAGNNPIVQAIKAPITIAEFLGRLTDVHIWIRVGEVAGGAVLIVIGVRMLARESGIDIPIPRIPKVG